MFAVINSYYGRFGNTQTVTDITSWAGDLLTPANDVGRYREFYSGDSDEQTYAAAYDLLGMVEGEPHDKLSFDLDDLLADVDGFNIAYEAKRLNLSISEIFPSYYTQGHVNTRFTDFYNRRFSGDPDVLLHDALEIMNGNNVVLVAARLELLDGTLNNEELNIVATAFYDKIMCFVIQE